MPDVLRGDISESHAPVGTDDWDRHWEDFAGVSAANPAQEYRRRLALGLLAADGPPARIVDIGSGTGELAAAIAGHFPDAEVLGIELSKAAVAAARRSAPRATFLQRDLLESGAPPPEFRSWATHAVCSEVLEHVGDPARLLRNARAYLAPGCRLVVTVPGGPITAFDRHIGHQRHYRPADLRELLSSAGYAVERTAGAGFPFFNLYRLAVLARGERLVSDATARDGRLSRGARAAVRVLDVLFRLNTNASPWGWQTVAVATAVDDADAPSRAVPR